MEENNKIRKVLYSEAGRFWAIALAIIAVVSFFYKIQLDVALIKENHAAHIEAIIVQIGDLKKTDTDAALERKDLMKMIIENNSKLDRLLGKFDLK